MRAARRADSVRGASEGHVPHQITDACARTIRHPAPRTCTRRRWVRRRITTDAARPDQQGRGCPGLVRDYSRPSSASAHAFRDIDELPHAVARPARMPEGGVRLLDLERRPDVELAWLSACVEPVLGAVTPAPMDRIVIDSRYQARSSGRTPRSAARPTSTRSRFPSRTIRTRSAACATRPP